MRSNPLRLRSPLPLAQRLVLAKGIARARQREGLTCSPAGVRYALAPTMAPKFSSSPAMRAHSKSWCFWGASSRADAPSASAASKRDGSSGAPASCTLRRTWRTPVETSKEKESVGELTKKTS